MSAGPAPASAVRRLVPYALLPLAVVACVLASAPWFRLFPAASFAVPLVGTALLSVLLPVLVIAIGARRVWLTALLDVAGFLFFTALVTLHQPLGFATLWTALLHGPSEILTFALPLSEPRSLMVAPIALCWLGGAVFGECLGRSWRGVAPYATLLLTFGLAYAGSTRGITDAGSARRYDTLLAGGLLLVLLLLRAGQAWLQQDDDADAAQTEGALPLRALGLGALGALVATLVAVLVVQTSPFRGATSVTARTPPLSRSFPITPLSFVAGLRPDRPDAPGQPVFDVTINHPSSRYVALADVNIYDGDGWTFDRQFRPSGGVLAAGPDPGARPRGPAVTQRYRIVGGALTTAPWMPFQYRPQSVTGVAVDVDQSTGMIVPRRELRPAQTYTVRSRVPSTVLGTLPRTALPGTAAPPEDTVLPFEVRSSLDAVISTLEDETQVPRTQPLAFLQALARDFAQNYALSGRTTITRDGQTSSATPSGSPAPSPTAEASRTVAVRAGGNSFASVLASILGPTHSATPEQFATLITLIARQLNIPARLTTGFRLPAGRGAVTAAGTYTVTTREAWTWAEVPVRGRGWVVVDGSPSAYSTSRPTPSLSARPTQSPSPTAAPSALLTQAPTPGTGNAAAPPSSVPVARYVTGALIALALLVLVLVPLLFLGGLVVRKRWRLRRRGHGTPRERLAGAWQETLDMLVESGMPPVSTLTGAEVVAAAEQRYGPEPAAAVRGLAESANRAIFHPGWEPSAADADEAWRAERTLRRHVRGTLDVGERIHARLRYARRRSTPVAAVPRSWSDPKPPRPARGGRRPGGRRQH